MLSPAFPQSPIGQGLAHEMALPTFRMGSFHSSLVNPTEKIPCRPTQPRQSSLKLPPQGILGCFKLTVKTSSWTCLCWPEVNTSSSVTHFLIFLSPRLKLAYFHLVKLQGSSCLCFPSGVGTGGSCLGLAVPVGARIQTQGLLLEQQAHRSLIQTGLDFATQFRLFSNS